MQPINNLFLAIILSLTSCQDKDAIVLPNVEGKWDLQIEGSADLLWHYEQGFELLNNGTYLPRYWRGNATWKSESQESSILTWKLIKENDEIRIFFYYEFYLFNEAKKYTAFYTIASIQTDSMQLVGYSPDGNKLDLYMIKEQ